MRKFVMVMMAAALVSIGVSLAASKAVPASATVKLTCMSDGSMRIDSDAKAP